MRTPATTVDMVFKSTLGPVAPPVAMVGFAMTWCAPLRISTQARGVFSYMRMVTAVRVNVDHVIQGKLLRQFGKVVLLTSQRAFY